MGKELFYFLWLLDKIILEDKFSSCFTSSAMLLLQEKETIGVLVPFLFPKSLVFILLIKIKVTEAYKFESKAFGTGNKKFAKGADKVIVLSCSTN